MTKQFGNEDPRIADYVARVYAPEDDVLREIRERSAREGLPDIQVAGLDGRHLEVLTRAVGARRNGQREKDGTHRGCNASRPGLGDPRVNDAGRRSAARPIRVWRPPIPRLASAVPFPDRRRHRSDRDDHEREPGEGQ